MAHTGTGFFDSRGQYFDHPDHATVSDLAMLLGRIGEGESMAEGIAHLILEKRADIIAIFADHEAMLAAGQASSDAVVTTLRPAG